jgi:hypothetical protein
MKNKKQKNIKIISVVVLAVAVCMLLIYIFGNFNNTEEKGINNFIDCVNAGYPIMETHPMQCRTPDGRTFTQDINKGFEFSYVTVPQISHETKKEYLIQNNQEYRNLFGEDSEIDFEKHTLIIAFMGEKLSGGYSNQIAHIEETEKSIKIRIMEISPGKNCMVTMAITYPQSAVLIEKTDKTLIEYFYNKQTTKC